MRRIGSGFATALLLITACGGGAVSTTAAPAAAPTTAATVPPTTAPPATTEPSTTPATTEPAPTTTLKAEIAIQGSDDFVGHTQNALALLQEQAGDMYGQVFTYVDRIKSVPAGSGIHVETKTFDVGEETAYAPGYNLTQQVAWYAGAIAHDSCHSRLYANGEPHIGKNAEISCLQDQLAALQSIGATRRIVDYVQGLIEGADDPENQYWNDPNRHW